ncbi:MAG: DUF488 domain-containing protein [Tepidisphaeraceae bacterium]
MNARRVIFTIGHSTRSADELLAILRAHGVEAVADVRLIPKSRRYPHFNAAQLARSLPEAGIAYIPFQQLGGRRRPAKDSVNTGWRNESFRGYADFMQTPAFARALAELEETALQQPTATMCAEAVPWRCHRSLISDGLLVRGWQVLDITSATKALPHELTRFAKVDGLKITYPPEDAMRFPT